ncbi:MAG TPA: response regulator [Acidimicrobiia bacterium]|jgi:two-component system chemotaxis response regulator CheY
MQAMVVDDSRAMRMLMGRLLKDIGFEVAEAGDGSEALDSLRERLAGNPVQLALVDWNMPEMSGIELVEAVRSDPAFAGLRIVMVTTETELSQVTRALDAGADEYLMKPFTRDDVVGKLELLGLAV